MFSETLVSNNIDKFKNYVTIRFTEDKKNNENADLKALIPQYKRDFVEIVRECDLNLKMLVNPTKMKNK
jgi:hypothetical protein